MCQEGFGSEILNFQFKSNENKQIVFVSTMFTLDFNFLPKGLHLGYCRYSMVSPEDKLPIGFSSLFWTPSEAKT